jgi:hypothetical protein
MRFRWTKRPQNQCRKCGHTWFPRGSDISVRCPECRSTATALALDIVFEDIAHAFEMLFSGLWVVISQPFRWLFHFCAFLMKVLDKIGKRLSMPQRCEPMIDETVSGQVADLLSIVLYVIFLISYNTTRWLLSIKDDFLSLGKLPVNPVLFGLKLLTIWIVAVLLIGGFVLLLRKWSGGG